MNISAALETFSGQNSVAVPINIVFGSDQSFLPYTAVAIQSLLQSYSDDRPLCIYLLVDRPLSSEDRDRFWSLKAIRPFDLFEITVDASSFSNVRTTAGISVATYYRLYMHRLLPPDAQKAIWLDGDIVVRDCIGKLFDTDLGNALFAGVEDSHSNTYRRRFGVPEHAVNVNCGVLVSNLAAMRSFDFLGEVQRFVSENGEKVMLGDQQIINTLFYNRTIYVALRWNMHGKLLDPKWVKKNRNLNNLSKIEITKAFRQPAIVHYCGHIKPWNSGTKQLAAHEWREVAEISPYRQSFSDIPKANRRTLRSRIRRLMWKLGERRRIARKLRRFARKANLHDIRFDHHILDKTIQSQMRLVLFERGQRMAQDDFSARTFIERLPDQARIAMCGNNEDVTGGFHENLKTLFRTPHIGTHVGPHRADACLYLLQNIRHLRHWDCLRAANMGTPLIFAEANFFGAYAGYFDKEADADERRAFGYIFDDLGYYFDANQPSRLEVTLNNPKFRLTDKERRRVHKLIERVRRERLTKYNKYVRADNDVIEPGGVLVIDQRPQDASIIFGAANGQTFRSMLASAISENPDRQIFIKRHPDNIHNNVSALRHHKVEILPNDFDITSALDLCHSVYTVTSQVGFEALLRRKNVVTFGLPFYAGWGLTDDRQRIPRRKITRSVEDLFHVALIKLSAYIDPQTRQPIEIEQAFDHISRLRGAR